MDSPRASVIIRCYNEADHIGKLLHGLSQQSMQNFEIILVDSGSTDGTIEIAEEYGVDEIVYIDPEDFSFGRALNYGCEAARGDICVFASAHDNVSAAHAPNSSCLTAPMYVIHTPANPALAPATAFKTSSETVGGLARIACWTALRGPVRWEAIVAITKNIAAGTNSNPADHIPKTVNPSNRSEAIQAIGV